MSRRVNKADGSFGGSVCAGVVTEYFTRFFRPIDLGKHGVVALMELD